MGLFKSFVSQTRKPEGLLGKMMLSGMNSGHAKLADWGFTHLPDSLRKRQWIWAAAADGTPGNC